MSRCHGAGESDCVCDYVMCVFCFFTVFCDKILDPNYEKANFYFVSCSEEEDQGVLESEEEEEMDSDSSEKNFFRDYCG